MEAQGRMQPERSSSPLSILFKGNKVTCLESQSQFMADLRLKPKSLSCLFNGIKNIVLLR